MRSRKIFLVLGLFVVFSSPGQAQMQDYWLVDEYFALKPQQQKLSEQFNLKVQRAPQPENYNQQRPATILVVYPGEQVSDYWRRSVDSFTARLEALGIAYELQSEFTKPGTDIRLQSRLIGKSLQNPPDYLVFTLDALKHRTLIEKVMARGQTKIILQNITTPIKAFGDRQPFLYVGFDHGIGSDILARQYQKQFDAGEYAVLYGTRGYVSQMRGGVFERALNQRGGYKKRAAYYVNFNHQLAAEATVEILQQHPQIRFIYACSTDIGLGALEALKEAGREDIQVNGWGGGSAELDSIQAKGLAFTVMRMNDDNGVAMAEAIALDLLGRAAEVPVVFSGEFRLVDQATSPAEIEQLKQRAFRYSQ